MDWNAIGAAGEVIGAAAVVVTLFYLASQIKQNSGALNRSNQIANASSIHATNVSYSQVFSQLAQDAELASIYRRALENEPLDADETVRFSAFLNTYFVWLEDVYFQLHENVGFVGFADIDSDEFWATVGPHVVQLLSTNSGQSWWLKDPSCSFVPAFEAFVEEYVKSLNVGFIPKTGADA